MHFHNWEQGLQHIAKMEQPHKGKGNGIVIGSVHLFVCLSVQVHNSKTIYWIGIIFSPKVGSNRGLVLLKDGPIQDLYIQNCFYEFLPPAVSKGLCIFRHYLAVTCWVLFGKCQSTTLTYVTENISVVKNFIRIWL